MQDPSYPLPLTALTYHALLALADGDRHGYGIIKEVERRTGGAMEIETGTLYHAMKRMLDKELIQSVPPSERPADEDQRRRTYRLTEWGKEVLAAESLRLRQLVAIAEEKQVIPVRST
jgi:DNA-binding PadR family transcriptional regulator